jgi:hypothetical protein
MALLAMLLTLLTMAIGEMEMEQPCRDGSEGEVEIERVVGRKPDHLLEHRTLREHQTGQSNGFPPS